MTKWRFGPPPSIGWWPASCYENINCIRWWNGKWWSLSAMKGDSLKDIVESAKHPFNSQKDVKWHPRPKTWFGATQVIPSKCAGKRNNRNSGKP